MKFCSACKTVLTRDTSSGYVVMNCPRCGISYEGEPTDTLIYSNFNPSSDTDIRRILKLAPFDRVNKIQKIDCSCGRKYMTQVVIDNVATYVCDNCQAQIRGSQLKIK